MKVINLGVKLRFILETLRNIHERCEKLGISHDSDIILILEDCLLNLENWVTELENVFEKCFEIEVLFQDSDDNNVEFSSKHCLDLHFLLLTLQENIVKIHESELMNDLIIFNRLIKCVSILDELLLELKDDINLFEDDLFLE